MCVCVCVCVCVTMYLREKYSAYILENLEQNI